MGKTMLRRIEQFHDRWSTWSKESGLIAFSKKPTPKQLREIEIFSDLDDAFLEKISPDVAIGVWREGSVLFEEGAYLDLAFFVVEGEVEVFLERDGQAAPSSRPIYDLSRTQAGLPGVLTKDSGEGQSAALPAVQVKPGRTQLRPAVNPEITFLASMDFDLAKGEVIRLGPGELFGEIGALSGWPQSTTVRTASECTFIQIRLPALRALKRKSKSLKARIDTLYRERSLHTQLQLSPLLAGCNPMFLEALKEVVELVSLEPGEGLVQEGEEVDALYLVRSGFLKLSQLYGDGEMVVTYLSKGMTLGEIELLIEGIAGWETTVSSVEYSELVKIPRNAVLNLLKTYPEVEAPLWQSATQRLKEIGLSRRDIGHSEFIKVALDDGLVEGNSILAIDLERCTRCDDCVRACAETHGGRPRFIREGKKYQNLLLARSCYHCRDPVCLVGCPTGAIHRAGVSDVVAIDESVCIGCSTCARNCPYDAIVMHDAGDVWPDDMVPTGLRGRDRLVASKCDLCRDTGHDPACVSNCPQGCAYRVGTVEEFDLLLRRTGD